MKPAKDFKTEKFVPTSFSLPLFMVSRNRIKSTKLNELKNHIKKKIVLYNKCTDNRFKNKSLKNCNWNAADISLMGKALDSNVKNKTRSKLIKETLQLPPNLFDVNKIPYAVKKGISGAHWPRKPKHESKLRPSTRQSHHKIYNLPANKEKKFTPCNRTKGIFFRSSQETRETSRCMVNCIATCYKSPSDPGPTTYNPIFIQKLSEKKCLNTPNPYLFYFSSCVPIRENIIHNPHTSFTGAPGRYETRYPKSCPCSANLLYYPKIDILIDKEKQKKFRRLSYEVIKARKYTAPDWRHVKGRGFRYLFIEPNPSQSKHLAEPEFRRQKSLKLYPDSKYIEMINNPSRTPLSLRTSLISNLAHRIKFNCMPKIIAHANFRTKKKIAFNSSEERFINDFRLPVITVKQQENIKLTLPIERQFRNYPVTDKRLSDINSKLNQIPPHMLPIYMPTLKKKIFKFQALPKAKLLVAENKTNDKTVSSEGYYFRSLETKKFFNQNLCNTNTISPFDMFVKLLEK